MTSVQHWEHIRSELNWEKKASCSREGVQNPLPVDKEQRNLLLCQLSSIAAVSVTLLYPRAVHCSGFNS